MPSTRAMAAAALALLTWRSATPEIAMLTAATMRSGIECAGPRRDAFEVYGLDLILDDFFRVRLPPES